MCVQKIPGITEKALNDLSIIDIDSFFWQIFEMKEIDFCLALSNYRCIIGKRNIINVFE